MAATNINIRIDNEVKVQAQEVLSKFGLDLTTAVNLFAQAFPSHSARCGQVISKPIYPPAIKSQRK